MLQSCPHIRTKSIVIIIENANKSNGFGQSMGGTSTSRSKGLGYHEIEQEASSLVDISHRQVYCLELGDSIISKSSKKPKVLLNGFLTKYPLTWQKTPSVRLPWGRKNWLFCDTPKGAEASAVVYSMVESAKANGVEPIACLQRVLVELPYLGKSPSHEGLEAFMPWTPGLQEDRKIPNSDAYTNTYLE